VATFGTIHRKGDTIEIGESGRTKQLDIGILRGRTPENAHRSEIRERDDLRSHSIRSARSFGSDSRVFGLAPHHPDRPRGWGGKADDFGRLGLFEPSLLLGLVLAGEVPRTTFTGLHSVSGKVTSWMLAAFSSITCLIVSADAGGLAFADASVAPISANTAPAHSMETIQFTRRIAPSTVPVTPSPTSPILTQLANG